MRRWSWRRWRCSPAAIQLRKALEAGRLWSSGSGEWNQIAYTYDTSGRWVDKAYEGDLGVAIYHFRFRGIGVHGTPYAMTTIINGKSSLIHSSAGRRFVARLERRVGRVLRRKPPGRPPKQGRN